MIELAVFKSVVELYKQVLSIIAGRAKNKRESFERTFKPLFERMETIAKEYYAAVSKVASQLSKPSPDFAVIVEELTASRSGIVIARNGIIGDALAYKKKYRTEDSNNIFDKDDLNQLAYAFADSLYYYFSESEEIFELQSTAMTGLIRNLELLADPPPGADLSWLGITPQRVRSEARHALQTLENRWVDVSKAYADLKLFCQS